MNNAQQNYDNDRFYNPEWEDETMDQFDAERDMHTETIKINLRRFGVAKDFKANMVDVIEHVHSFEKLRPEDNKELNDFYTAMYANASEGLKKMLDRNIVRVSENQALKFMKGSEAN